jgi:aminoglycoside phosphotransferase (APT) family kinase protein
MERLLARITQEFPDVKWTSVQIEDEGWDHFAVILDDSVVFRLPKTEEKSGYFSDEIALLELVANHTSVRIPKVTHVSQNKTIMGYPYLPGDELTAGAIELFDEELFGAVSEQLALFLGDLHEIPPEACQAACLAERVPQDDIDWLRAGYREHLQGRLPDEECVMIERYIQDLESCMSSCLTRVLLHADLGLEHVILDYEQRRISIIDFSDWAFGDPAFDFCGLLYDSPTLAREVIRKYRHKEDCDDILARAEVYSRRVPISLMIDSFRGYPCGFDESYQRFKRLFRITETIN